MHWVHGMYSVTGSYFDCFQLEISCPTRGGRLSSGRSEDPLRSEHEPSDNPAPEEQRPRPSSHTGEGGRRRETAGAPQRREGPASALSSRVWIFTAGLRLSRGAPPPQPPPPIAAADLTPPACLSCWIPSPALLAAEMLSFTLLTELPLLFAAESPEPRVRLIDGRHSSR